MLDEKTMEEDFKHSPRGANNFLNESLLSNKSNDDNDN